MDMHHVHEVSEGGSDAPSNLIALCPTCHALYHRGTISRESIYVSKAMHVAMTRAFNVNAIDKLLFLEAHPTDFLVLSGDGLLHFGGLISAGLAETEVKANNNWQLVTYSVNLTDSGRRLITAWKKGDRSRVGQALTEVGLLTT
jgi:hypothetical protein